MKTKTGPTSRQRPRLRFDKDHDQDQYCDHILTKAKIKNNTMNKSKTKKYPKNTGKNAETAQRKKQKPGQTTYQDIYPKNPGPY